jgi:hypothetical protein
VRASGENGSKYWNTLSHKVPQAGQASTRLLAERSAAGPDSGLLVVLEKNPILIDHATDFIFGNVIL